MKVSSNYWKTWRRQSTSATGYSLIEVLAALLLASILMVSILQLLKNLHSRERLVDRTINLHAAWQDRLFQSLERDLRNSRRIRIQSGMFELEGHCGTDIDRGLADLSEAVVTWRVVASEKSSVVVREERPIVLTSNAVRREVMAVNVSDMSFWYHEAPQVSYLHGDATAAPTGDRDGWTPVPKAIICRVDATRGTQTMQLYRTLVLTAGGRR